jgi:multidrug resistance efflux pump
MGELSTMWSGAKNKLNDQQKAKLPKSDFGSKCDAFEASCEKARRELQQANLALWNAYVDGEKEKAGSVRELLEAIAQVANANKDIASAIANDIKNLDRKKANLLKGLMSNYKEIQNTADNLKAYKGN